MSAERSKILWISAAVAAFALVLALAGIFLFAPSKGAPEAPAVAGNLAAPKAQDPQDFLSTPPPAPVYEEPRQRDGDIIVIYGDKPQALPPVPPAIPSDSTISNQGLGGLAAGGQAPLNPQAAPQPGQPEYSAAPAPKTAAPAAKPAAKPAAAKPAPAPAPAVKTAAKPAAPKVQYWIQAASFSSRGRADSLKEALSSKGLASLIVVKDIDGKSWYRVRIGPYGGKAEAEGWLAKVKAVPGCAEAYVTK